MADIQSIYFAKDVIADSNEHGTRIILRELRFMVFRQETFFVVVSMINLDYEAEHIITMANYKFNPNKPGIFQWQSVDDVFLMVVD